MSIPPCRPCRDRLRSWDRARAAASRPTVASDSSRRQPPVPLPPTLLLMPPATISVAANLPLPADPIVVRVLPQEHIDGRDSFGYLIPDGMHVVILDATGFDIITSTISAPAPATLCPQTLTFISNDPLHAVQRVELNQGTLQPRSISSHPPTARSSMSLPPATPASWSMISAPGP